MRIVMPLFQYESTGINSYAFSSYPFSIQILKHEDIIKTELFSEQDLRHIKLEQWCLVFDGEDLANYIEYSNLLLMAFRVSSPCQAPFIKFRLCKESLDYCSRLNDPMTHNYESGLSQKVYTLSDLKNIDIYLGRLIEMKTTSTRTGNTLYFSFRGMTSGKWIDSFIMYMSAIESLFSKDAPGGATEIIKKRVASLLNPIIGVTKDDVGGLYSLRSDMVHGRVVINDDPNENLRELAKLERIVNACLNVFLEKGLYKNYLAKAERDKFMGTLNGP